MRIVSLALAGVAALLTLVALLTPWWTADMQTSGFGMDTMDAGTAGPFDNDDGLIGDGEAALAGVLVLLALLSALAAVVLWLLPGDLLDLVGLGCIALAALLLVVMAILAATTWPEDGGFWDSASAANSGFSASMTTAAGAGWYLALVAAALGLGAGAVQGMDLRRDEARATA